MGIERKAVGTQRARARAIERESQRKPKMMSSVQIVSNKAGVRAAAVSGRRAVAAKRTAAVSSVNRAERSLAERSARSVKVSAGDDIKSTAEDLLTTAAEKWEETEDKPTVVTLALLGALDKVPFLGGILELVGIGYTAYFAYNNLLFTPDRENLSKKVNEIKDKIL